MLAIRMKMAGRHTPSPSPNTARRFGDCCSLLRVAAESTAVARGKKVRKRKERF
ncbi:MAG: hypothetical protein JWN34_3932 [Bryobacterales bacterium]|nr:hypothetical protein [Bryobacterales bacterium]